MEMNGATVRDRLEAALREKYDDVHLELGPVRPGRVSGLVITAHFLDKDTERRQDELWDVIRKTLGPESVDVSTLVTLTPQEYQDMQP
jgi:hypothetical protein